MVSVVSLVQCKLWQHMAWGAAERPYFGFALCGKPEVNQLNFASLRVINQVVSFDISVANGQLMHSSESLKQLSQYYPRLPIIHWSVFNKASQWFTLCVLHHKVNVSVSLNDIIELNNHIAVYLRKEGGFLQHESFTFISQLCFLIYLYRGHEACLNVDGLLD